MWWKQGILKRIMILFFMGLLLNGCGSKQPTVYIFAEESLNEAIDELISQYETTHTDIKIIGNYDSVEELMEQIKNSSPCDIFFSTSQIEIDTLKEGGWVKEDLTGEVSYPVALIENSSASKKQQEQANEFFHFIIDEAGLVYAE